MLFFWYLVWNEHTWVEQTFLGKAINMCLYNMTAWSILFRCDSPSHQSCFWRIKQKNIITKMYATPSGFNYFCTLLSERNHSSGVLNWKNLATTDVEQINIKLLEPNNIQTYTCIGEFKIIIQQGMYAFSITPPSIV